MPKNPGIIAPVELKQLDSAPKFLGLSRRTRSVVYEPPPKDCLPQEPWHPTSAGPQELNLQTPVTDGSATVVSFEEYFQEMRQRRFQPDDPRLPECDSLVNRLLIAVRELEKCSVSPGVLTPANLIVHRAARLEKPALILADVGFRADRTPVVPAWLEQEGQFDFLWEATVPPEKFVGRLFDSRFHIPYLARMLAYLLDGLSQRGIPDEGLAEGGVAKVWEVLADGCNGKFKSIDEFRIRIKEAGFSHHFNFGVTPRKPNRKRNDPVYVPEPKPRNAPWGLIAAVALVVLACGALFYFKDVIWANAPQLESVVCCPDVAAGSRLRDILLEYDKAAQQTGFSMPAAVPATSGSNSVAAGTPRLAPPQAAETPTNPLFQHRLNQLALLEELEQRTTAGETPATPEELACVKKLSREMYAKLGADWESIDTLLQNAGASPRRVIKSALEPFDKLLQKYRDLHPDIVVEAWERGYLRRKRDYIVPEAGR